MRRFPVAVCAAALALAALSAAAAPLNTPFTYQGRLEQNGAPVTGSADVRFQLFSVPAAGAAVSGFSDHLAQTVDNGIFTVPDVDFADAFYTGEERYLEISVRIPAGAGVWTTLAPRQRIAPAPYSLFSSAPWRTALGNEIYYDLNNVGVGLTNPSYPLDVEGDGVRVVNVENNSPAPGTAGFAIYAVSNAAVGRGIYAQATSPTNTTYGVWGVANSTAGRALYGNASSQTGTNYGVYGYAEGDSGYGVFGWNDSATGFTNGVYGRSDSNQGTGVYGSATAGSGLTYGVVGSVNSPGGWAGYFNGRAYVQRSLLVGGLTIDGPLATAHLLGPDAIMISDTMTSGEDLIIEDDDAHIGLFSTDAGAGGSSIELSQVDATFGSFQNKWSMTRETTTGGNGLRFTFGSSTNTFSNTTIAYFGDDGNVGIGTGAPEERLHIVGGTDTALGGGGYLVLGQTNALNVSIDNNEIMARENGNFSDLFLNANGGNVGIGTLSAAAKLHVVGGTDAAPASGGYLVCGPTSDLNVVMDNNEIMARNNGATATLALNASGGNVAMIQSGTGGVTIGTTVLPAGAKLAVDGKILCEELEVQLSQDWPDYVFEDAYDLMPLDEVREFIREHKHLPGVPSAAQVGKDGVKVGEMQTTLLRKVEELTLHVLSQDRQVATLREENERLRERLSSLESAGR